MSTNTGTMTNTKTKTKTTRPASPPPPPPPPPPSPPPVEFHRSRSTPTNQQQPNDNKYFPKNRPRSRTPSPANSDSEERDGGQSSLLREWARSGDLAAPPMGFGTNHKRYPSRTNSAGGNLKHPSGKGSGKKRNKSMLRRTMSTGSHHSVSTTKSDHESYYSSSMASLFQVSFPADPKELAQVQEFDRIEPELKQKLWYFAKELKYLLACEVERNRAYEDGDIDLQQDETEEDVCCWRGLEHVWEGEDRSVRIRKTVSGIVNWHKDAKEMGYNDPDELRVVSKARTKSDRTKAQKKANQDASYIKKLHKTDLAIQNGEMPSPSSKSMSPKKMVKRISAKITSIPTLHWSPKPSKKAAAAVAS